MASQAPSTPSSIPKRSFPSFSVRRPSATMSGTSFSATSMTAAVAASPTPPHNTVNNNSTTTVNTSTNLTAGSGIPASLRSLRNLLPFGGGNSNQTKAAHPPTNTTATPSRSPFVVGLGSVRKSMHITREKEKEKDRDRKMSLSDEALMAPVLSIERRPSEHAAPSTSAGDDQPLRRSVSLSGLEAAAAANFDKALPNSAPTLRTPSPGPCLLAELSTIIEADSSGISKYIPLLTPSTESSWSFSPPPPNILSSEDIEEHTICRPILHPSTTPLMASSPLTPSTPAHQQHPSTTVDVSPSFSTDCDTSVSEVGDMQLSTSELALQVQDAMARTSTSWAGDSDRAFVIDADASFVQTRDMNESDDGTSVENEADADASLLAVVDVELDSPNSLPSADRDDTSRINNSVTSVVNPNELYDANGTMDLASLDPDLRAAVLQWSPMSIGHSSASGRTITLSAPPVPPRQRVRQQQQSTPTSISSPSTSVPAPSRTKPTLQPFAAPSMSSDNTLPSTNKRRIASSFLPRLRSPRSRSTSIPASASAPVSEKDSPSPQKANFDSAIRESRIPGSPKTGVFFPPLVPPVPSMTGAGSMGAFPMSTPAKVKSKKGFGALGTGASVVGGSVGHGRKSSVPVASWRNSREIPVLPRENEKDDVHPEVRIVDASSEIDPMMLSDAISKRWGAGDTGKLSVEGVWSSRGSPIPGYESDTEGQAQTRLGSPFCTPGDREKLNGQSPSHSPCPSPAPPHLRSTTPHKHLHPDNDISTTPTRFAPSPSPSPYVPPQSLVPSPVIASSSTSYIHTHSNSTPAISRSGSLRNTVTGGADDDTEGGSPSRIFDGGSLSGRPSRRVPAPLRLFWGSSGSASTASSGATGSAGSGGTGTGEERISVPERQPSPLRSVLRVDAFGREEDEDYLGDDVRKLVQGRSASARPSIDESTPTSVRPSLDSTRPSMDSYGGSSSLSTVDPTYHKYVVDTPPSRPPTRLKEQEGQGLVARVRKRSMSVQENFDGPSSGHGGLGGGVGNLSSAALSARERLARARYGDLGGGARPWSSMSMRSGRTTDTLNNSRAGRTSSVYDRERSPVIGCGGIERSVSERTADRERDRERSGSVSTAGLGTLGRYASLRSASEYNFGGNSSSVNLSVQQPVVGVNTRSFSRMTFTEGPGASSAGHGRRESGTFSSMGHTHSGGLMESPTFTISTSASGSRDTTRSTSTSTGATSISQLSSKDRDREREKEELRELKEKHSVETGALLGALSDSQRTCRVLREENTELRDKMAEMERDNERLKAVVGELEREIEALNISTQRERERERVWSTARERLWDPRGEPGLGSGRGLSASVGPNGNWRTSSTPIAKPKDVSASRSVLRSSAVTTNKWHVFERDLEREEGLDATMRQTSRSKLDKVLFSRETAELELEMLPEQEKSLHYEDMVTPVEEHVNHLKDGDDQENTFLTAANATSAHIRRPSTSSSIFPIPPSNMTMLLHDELGLLSTPDQGSNRSSPSLLAGIRLPPTSPVPSFTQKLKDAHQHSVSVASNVSLSPTTENFSMVTGSPGSLFLRPEHEMMLDEMESLDLGSISVVGGANEA